MTNERSYWVKLSGVHINSPEKITALSAKHAAEIFAKRNKHYGVAICVTKGLLDDPFIFAITADSQISEPEIINISVELPLVDLALIAKKAVSAFPYDDYEEVSELLNGTTENRKVISELNEKTRSKYQELVEQKILDVQGASFDLKQASQSIDELTIKAMELGLRSVLKKYIPESSSQTSISGGQEIEGKGTWDDLKSRI